MCDSVRVNVMCAVVLFLCVVKVVISFLCLPVRISYNTTVNNNKSLSILSNINTFLLSILSFPFLATVRWIDKRIDANKESKDHTQYSW